MIYQILRLFANILATNDKYPDLNRDKLTIPIQMQLSQKKKKYFSRFFTAFFKSGLNVENFGKKYGPYKFCISEITESQNVVR